MKWKVEWGVVVKVGTDEELTAEDVEYVVDHKIKYFGLLDDSNFPSKVFMSRRGSIRLTLPMWHNSSLK